NLVGGIGNWNDQVCNRVGHDGQLTLLTHTAGDLQHFVVDHIGQVVARQDQVQCTLDLDAVDVDRHQAVGIGGFFFHSLGVQVNVDVRDRLDLLDDFAQRNLVFMQRDSLCQAFLNAQLFGTSLAIIRPVFALA